MVSVSEKTTQQNGSGSSELTPLLVLPSTISARQRAILHGVCESHDFFHLSEGEGKSRRIQIGDAKGPKVEIEEDVVSDDRLCRLLEDYLSIDARANFSAPASYPIGSSAKSGLIDVEKFVSLTESLLELERQEEVQQATDVVNVLTPEAAQARGSSLLNLRVEDMETGLMGRTLVKLVSGKGFGAGVAAPELPPHHFGPHDVVALRPYRGGSAPPLASGVIYRVHERSIILALEDAPDDDFDGPLRLDKLANETTFQRYRETLSLLLAVGTGGGAGSGAGSGAGKRSYPGGGPAPGSGLVDLMFRRSVEQGPAQRPVASSGGKEAVQKLAFKNEKLDEIQKRAVCRALSSEDLFLIHGPPGTGKTTTVVEYILQEASRGRRVLVCAASNVAVDNLVERLAKLADPKLAPHIVRLGHPARLLPQVLEQSLEARVLRADNSALARDCRKDLKDLSSQLAKLERWKRAERNAIRASMRQLAKEERKRQGAAVLEVLRSARVVCCTLTGAAGRDLSKLLASHALNPVASVGASGEGATGSGKKGSSSGLSKRKAMATTSSNQNDQGSSACTTCPSSGDDADGADSHIDDQIVSTGHGDYSEDEGNRQKSQEAARVSLSSPSSSSSFFDVVVVDEAAQALEVACWSSMLKAPRAVLAGDHLQLPPTVISEAAARGGLARTLFERAMQVYGAQRSEMLTVQYRMHESIMRWSSEEMYGGQLVAHPSVATHTLATLGVGTTTKAGHEANAAGGGGKDKAAAKKGKDKDKDKDKDKKRGNNSKKSGDDKKKGKSTIGGKGGVNEPGEDSNGDGSGGGEDATSSCTVSSALSQQLRGQVVLLVDTNGCDCEEDDFVPLSSASSASAAAASVASASIAVPPESRSNQGEARVVFAHVRALLASGIAPEDIGVITPYNGQVRLLRELRPEALATRLEISTVDGFQGREKEAVVISAVRSNPEGVVGFLADARRMNVAITRARRHCVLVGDSETLRTRQPFLSRLVGYFEQNGDYASADEVLQYGDEGAAFQGHQSADNDE